MAERVLVIINTIDAGGAEGFVMKIFRKLDKEKFVFDFLINVRNSNFYLKEIQALGGKVFYGYPKSKHPFKSFKSVQKTVREGNYKIVFCVAVHPLGFLDLWASKRGGAKVRIIRSANSKSGGKLSKISAKICRPLVKRFATEMVAPSTEAGIWMYGEKVVKSDSFLIIPNGIEPSAYAFQSEYARDFKQEYGIENDKTIIGHVGRFNTQKNHDYLVDIFYHYHIINPNSILLLVGSGNLMEKVQEKIISLGIKDSVIFTGTRSDVVKVMSAMDVLVMPSLYEGMPNVVIEAQACGLKCLISDAITKEAKITDLVTYESISDDPKKWADILCSILESDKKPRESYTQDIIDSGYASSESTKRLVDLFSKVGS